MDRITKERRSLLMSKIRGKNTGPELAVFSELRRNRIYFRRHYDKVAGSPDVALPTKKIAVFIDGDFWHGYRYPCWKNKLPSDFWRQKIERNRARDKRNFAKLRKSGWLVLRVWERELRSDFDGSIRKVVRHLKLRPRLIPRRK